MVDVRPRTGIHCNTFDFMQTLRTPLFFSIAQDRNLFELFSNLRIHVEMAYWHEATDRLTLEDKMALKALVARAWEKLRNEHIIIPHSEHRAFHLGIFKRLENPFVNGILAAYWEAYEAVELNRYAEYAYLERVWTYHDTIADELVAGDHQASLEAFIEHTQLLRHQPNPHVSKQSASPEAITVKHNQKG